LGNYEPVLRVLAKMKRHMRKSLPPECREPAIRILEEYQAEIEELMAAAPIV